MTMKQITVSEFKAHCAEGIRTVESGDVALEITRHGKTVAVLQKPEQPVTDESATFADLMGSLRGTVSFADDYDPDEPAFAPEDWEDHPANQSGE